jgi:CheY-like chemotaxis protein
MPFASPPSAPILVIDDDLATREALSLLLIAEGYCVQTAADGAAALRQLHHGERPALIVLDLMMPIMDGWQFRREQLGDPRLADIPVIVCSASFRIGPQAVEPHALAYLDKPIDPRELVGMVHRCYPRADKAKPRP